MNILKIHNKKRKFVCLVIVVITSLFLSSFSAALADPAPETDFEFDSITGTITAYIGSGGDVEIPAEIDGVAVIRINAYAFDSCTTITGISIPDSVTSIGEYAFLKCTNLTSVTLSNNITTISDNVFCECSSLTSIIIPDGVTSIGDSAFNNCSSLTTITIPDSVTSIGWYAFKSCSSLGSVILSSNITSIGRGTFTACGLTSITIPDGVTSIDDYAFYFCSNLENLNIPDNVISIGSYALAGTALTSVTIPEGIDTIEEGTFKECTLLSSVVIPDSITSIGQCAFQYCASLDIDIPDNITSIGAGAFCGTALSNAVIPAGVNTIEEVTFSDCSSLASVSIPDSVTSIGEDAFYGCLSLGSVIIPHNVSSICDYAFNSCSSLESAYFNGDAPSTFGTEVFDECAEGFVIYYYSGTTGWSDPWNGYDTEAIADTTSPTVTGLSPADDAADAGLYDDLIITFDENIAAVTGNITIKQKSDDSELETMDAAGPNVDTSGNTVTINPSTEFTNNTGYYVLIDAGAFEDTSGNSYAGIADADSWNFTTIAESEPEFEFNPSTGLITGYNGAGGDVEIPAEIDGVAVTGIGDNAFQDCDTLTSVIIPASVTSIGSYAFYDCTYLESVAIPDGISSISSYAFSGTALTSVTIPSSVNTIEVGTFYGCWYLESASIADSVTSIEDGAFCDCPSLTNITIPESVGSIGIYSFAYCTSLSSITISSNITSIAEGMFLECSSIASVTIPDGVSSIGIHAFENCTSLTSILIPDGVTSIASYAFSGAGITSITLPEGVTSIEEGTFCECSSLNTITIPISISNVGDGAFYYCSLLESTYFEGNAPAAFGTQVFDECADDFIIYYYSGTTGWSDPWNGYDTHEISDTTPPTAVACSPADGDENIGLNANLIITFNEAVTEGSGNITIKKANDDSTVETIDVAGDKVSISGKKATINPDITFTKNTNYYVLIDSGSFKDLSGNSYAGIAKAVTWNFKTESSTGGFPGGGLGGGSASTTEPETVENVQEEALYGVQYTVKNFEDIDCYPWAEEAIRALSERGIINGISDTEFAPQANITRADFVVLIVRFLELDGETAQNFTDINTGAYYFEAVGIASNLGIVSGTGNNEFNPLEPISRQDMMVIIKRALDITGKSSILTEETGKTLSDFGDSDKASVYAKDSIEYLIGRGIVNGDGGRINPNGYTTRAEVAVLLNNLLKQLNN